MKSIKDVYGDGLDGKYYEGTFDCSNKMLTSLEGSPAIIDGDFHCYFSQLESLKGGPRMVGGNFFCFSSSLTSLEGAPECVSDEFDCNHRVKKGDNLYIIANALLNGRYGRSYWSSVEQSVLEDVLLEYFSYEQRI
jgi:hypothetical protein